MAPEGGGIADRPGDMVDVFHTQFGVAGMLPVARRTRVWWIWILYLYCMPADLIAKMGLVG